MGVVDGVCFYLLGQLLEVVVVVAMKLQAASGLQGSLQLAHLLR